MNKSDLKTGMRVEHRNGRMSIVVLGIDGGDRIVNERSRDGLDYYDDNFNNNKNYHEFDFVRIYDKPDYIDIPNLFNIELKGELLWERQEPIELTMQEIADKFGVSVENLKIKK